MPATPDIRTNGPHRGYDGFAGTVGELASQSTPAWSTPVPAGAAHPNIVMILVDDLGFSDLGAYGSEIPTPNIDSLANGGFRFTNFHSAPVCSPARAALLTGLNPHRAGFGTVSHGDPGFPGYRLEIDDEVPTIAEKLRRAGYGTYMVGKWHLTIESKMHDGADRSSWPTQKGFDRYFGSLDGFTSMYAPHRIVRDNSTIVDDEAPGDAYLTDVLTDEALGMLRTLRANELEKPFFLYLAHQAVHGPIQAKPTDLERVRGAYEHGWDAVRQQRFRRQIDAGLFAEGTELPHSQVAPWDTLTDDQRTLFACYMEVYAASVIALDDSVGRLVAYLASTGELENTVFALASDNGGTAEGGPDGTRSYFSQFVPSASLPAEWDRDVDRPLEHIGGPRAHVHYPAGWAQSSNTPFRQFKGSAYAGGIRVPLILSWLKGLPKGDGDSGVRHQYAFMTDLHATLLDLAGVESPERWRGAPAPELDGATMRPALADATAPASRTEQYVEFAGNRGLYADGWKVVTDHKRGTAFDDSEWELYDVVSDPTEVHNVREQHPDIVAQLGERWNRAAWLNTVFPLDDDGSLLSRRPEWHARFSQPVTLRPGLPTLERYRSSCLVVMRDFDIEASFDWQPGNRGVLVAHGDQGGGYSVTVEDDATVVLAYNAYGRMYHHSVPIEKRGAQVVRLRATCGAAFDWELELSVAALTRTFGSVPQLLGLAPYTGISVGIDRGGPVDWDRAQRRGTDAYTGAELSVRITPGKESPVSRGLLARVTEATGRLAD
ncbi:arylsulfatase [Mycetocola sp.]|uniref:arylsulfatase n=1 Tax=Mycetocola sp. TaxID=1871042 RepID=UPI0039896E93